MLYSDRLEEIIDAVTAKISVANRMGELESLLESWGLQELIDPVPETSASFYDTRKDGKIVVIGESQVKERDLLGIVKNLKLDKDRFEFCLDYDAIEIYNFKKLQWDINYRLVIVGPMPHSTTGKGNSRSTISEMEKPDNGYPKVIRLGSNRLKFQNPISKNCWRSSWRKTIFKGIRKRAANLCIFFQFFINTTCQIRQNVL